MVVVVTMMVMVRRAKRTPVKSMIMVNSRAFFMAPMIAITVANRPLLRVTLLGYT